MALIRMSHPERCCDRGYILLVGSGSVTVGACLNEMERSKHLMTDMLQSQSLETFLDTLASKSPTPGGGSVAALSGAMAAGLVSMVCAIDIQKQTTEEETEEVRSIWEQAEELRHELQNLAEADVEVFNRLSTAYKLPRTTEADAASRQAAIQKLTRHAAEVPLRTARAAARLVPLCTALSNRCSRLLVSDVGVAATLARATTQSSLINVEVNLASLTDQAYVREMRAQMEDMTVGLNDEAKGVLEVVVTRINQ
jgi:formiminotetrahydrofolate cyclodeaminase